MRGNLVNADETPVNILTLKGKNGCKKVSNGRNNAYMVVRAGTNKYNSPESDEFNFTDDRRSKTIYEYFKDYNGLLQTDGLSGLCKCRKVQ